MFVGQVGTVGTMGFDFVEGCAVLTPFEMTACRAREGFLIPLRCIRNDRCHCREGERGSIGGCAADAAFPYNHAVTVISSEARNLFF